MNAQGVPVIVNSGGSADLDGVQGQGVGSSNNAAINNCFCYKPAIIDGNTYPSKHGITALARAGSENGNWPMVRQSAWTVLEAKSKGFVPNRIATTALVNAIPDPVEGMMVFDLEADCLKINIDGTATGWKCFNTQTCP